METNGQVEKYAGEGFAFLKELKFVEAAEVFARALSLEPQNPLALYGRALSLRSLGDLPAAQAALDTALSAQPENPIFLLEQGALCAARGERERALEVFERVLSLDPNNDGARVGKAAAFVDLKRLPEAEALLAEVLGRSPDDTAALLVRAALECEREQYEQAAETCARAGGDEAAAQVASMLTVQGRHDAAEAFLRAALRKFSGSERLRNARGLLLVTREKYEEALDVFTATGSEDHAGLALLPLLMRATPEEFERLSEKITARFPRGARVLTALGSYLHEHQRYEEAVKVFDRVLELRQDIPQPYLWKLSSLHRQGGDGAAARLAAAGAFAQEALARFADDLRIAMECGRVFFKQQLFEKAAEQFRKVWEAKPDDEFALYNLLVTLRRHSRDGHPEKLEEAERLLADALEVSPARADLLAEQGWQRGERRQYAQALESFIASKDDGALAVFLDSLKTGKTPDELTKFLDAAVAFPDAAAALRSVGGALLSAQLYEEAVEYFDKMKARVSDEFTAQGKITALLNLGKKAGPAKLEEAAKFAAEAARTFPGSAVILEQQGWVFFEQKKYAEALEVFLKAGAGDAAAATVGAARLWRRLATAQRLGERARQELPGHTGVLNELAWVYLDQGKFAEALKEFEKVLELNAQDPAAAEGRLAALAFLRRTDEVERLIHDAARQFAGSESFWNNLSLYHFSQRKFDEALAAVDRALKIAPLSAFALQRKSAIFRELARAGDAAKRDEAEELLKEALARLPDDSMLLNERGWLQLDRDQPAEAERYFARALAANPANVSAGFGRAEALHRLNRGEEALRVYETLKEAFPEDTEVNSQLGWFHLNRADFDGAKNEFEAILRSDRQSLAARTGLGGVSFEQGDLDSSITYFRGVAEAAPKEAVYRANLGWALTRRGLKRDLDEAEKECQAALDLDPNLTAAYGCLGVVAFKRGKLRLSEQYFLRSIKVGGREGNYTDLGALYAQMGRYAEAEEQLKKALEINRYDVHAHIERGGLYLLQNKLKEAICEFREATAYNPQNEQAQRALAQALIREGNNAEAERVLRKALQSFDADQCWRLHITLSLLLIKRGDETDEPSWYEEALKEATKAVRLAPGEPDPYFHLGIIRHNLGDYRGAKRKFRQCLDRDPKHYDAERNLRLVQSLIRKEKGLQRGSVIGGILLGFVSLAQLVFIWAMYIRDKGVSENMLLVMIPILLGLFVISFLLPAIVRFKLPGLEAELSQPKAKDTTASGPTGSITPSLPATPSSGPR